ncbi:MAG: penicillin-binding transpeptidase domain-containing protein [Chloroflexi bacterium]|nr:penicillin-binding transpeptidase domain-containing protein [Chloroflexota bacterium]
MFGWRIGGFCLCICLLGLAGCGSSLLQVSQDGQNTSPADMASASAQPEEALAAFIEAWAAQDFPAMYEQLASRSRALYSQAQFADQYTSAHSSLGFAGVNHQLRGIDYQGATAILRYDIAISSPAFGTIDDSDRVMRMLPESGWKIAWSPMDIIKGMSSRARLTPSADFPRRADIYARDGMPLAQQSSLIYSLYAVQGDMSNIESCLATLAAATRMETSALRRIFADYLGETRFHIAEIDQSRYDSYREALAQDCDITRSEGAFSKVRSYNSRSYYGQGIAAHAVGYIGAIPADELERWQARGYESGSVIGRAGIEAAYEAALAGSPQRFLRIVETGGAVIRELAGAAGLAPRSVTLTLDRNMQDSMAQAIADAVNYAQPSWGGLTAGGAIVALDVNTGAVLALASYPSFDPQLFNPDTEYRIAAALQRLSNDGRSPLTNKALAEQYTPGSVYKIVTALAAGSEGIWGGDETFDCAYIWQGRGRFSFEDARESRTDWRLLEPGPPPPTGPVNMAQALAASCNPFFYEMGALLFERSANLQVEYAEILGLGRPTGLGELGREAAGELAPPREGTEAINNAIGQGSVGVTAAQMAQMTMLIANGGAFWQPYIVSHIGRPGAPGYEVVGEPMLAAQLELDGGALDIVREGMCLVTTDRDLGTAAGVFGDAPYTICGKTGTAETLGNPHSWFVAFAPREEPEIALAGVMAHSREGSEVVAPMIRRILDDYWGYPQKPYPDWWAEPYVPVKTQSQALAEYLAGG